MGDDMVVDKKAKDGTSRGGDDSRLRKHMAPKKKKKGASFL